MASPSDIEVLIHYFVSPTIHPRIDAGAVKSTINTFLKDGIFVSDTTNSNYYQVTEKGRAWLKVIVNTPYPKAIWVDQHGDKV